MSPDELVEGVRVTFAPSYEDLVAMTGGNLGQMAWLRSLTGHEGIVTQRAEAATGLRTSVMIGADFLSVPGSSLRPLGADRAELPKAHHITPAGVAAWRQLADAGSVGDLGHRLMRAGVAWLDLADKLRSYPPDSPEANHIAGRLDALQVDVTDRLRTFGATLTIAHRHHRDGGS